MSYQSLIPLVFSEIVGDFGFKKFANHGGIHNFVTGVFGYIFVIYFLIVSLQGSSILLVNAVWDALSGIVESIAVFIILGERFDEPIKYLGIVFIFIGLIFLKIPVFKKHTFVFPKFLLNQLQT